MPVESKAVSASPNVHINIWRSKYCFSLRYILQVRWCTNRQLSNVWNTLDSCFCVSILGILILIEAIVLFINLGFAKFEETYF